MANNNDMTMSRRSFTGLVAGAGAAIALGAAAASKAHADESAPAGDDDTTADLIVVGTGAAGFVAALKAADGGASVIMLEANSLVGGTTLLSGAHYKFINDFYLDNLPERTEESDEEVRLYLDLDPSTYGDFGDALATAQEQIAEYLDSDNEHEFDSIEFWLVKHYEGTRGVDRDGKEAEIDYDVIAPAFYNQVEVYEWLNSYTGLTYGEPNRFSRSDAGPMSMETDDNGAGVIATFQAKAETLDNITIITNTKATSLVTDGGKVCGVVADGPDGEVTYTANKGVLLACGGYCSNPQMVAEQNVFDGVDDTVLSVEYPNNDGTGIQMAQEVGGAVRGTEFVQFFSYPEAMMTSVMQMGNLTRAGKLGVNKNAVRFDNDSSLEYGDMVMESVRIPCDQPGARYYVIGDASGIERLGDDLEYYEDTGMLQTADTIEELAELVGLDGATLADTIDTFNSYCAAGEDPDFGREVSPDDAMGDGPYLVAPMAMYAMNTMGGVLIDTTGHVIDENGDPIEGLFAAGEITGNFDGTCRRHGDNIAQIFYYGYKCGEAIAEG